LCTADKRFSNLCRKREHVIQCIVEKLDDDVVSVRVVALRALHVFGKDAKDHSKKVASMLQDSYPHVQHQASRTLGVLGDHEEKVKYFVGEA
jgi:hypothetical protein